MNPKRAGLSNIRELAPWQNVAEDSDAGFAYLRTLADVRGDRCGLLGFCWGGEMTFASATQVRELKAVVVFYGRSPKPINLVKTFKRRCSPITAKKIRLSIRIFLPPKKR